MADPTVADLRDIPHLDRMTLESEVRYLRERLAGSRRHFLRQQEENDSLRAEVKRLRAANQSQEACDG